MENNICLSTGLFFSHILLQSTEQILVIFLRIILTNLFFFPGVLHSYLIDFDNLQFLFCSLFLSIFSKSLSSGNFDTFS